MAKPIPQQQVSTGNDIPGYRIVRSFGIMRGITVRSRSVVGNLGTALQTIVGGNISIYTELCEKAREEAFEFMCSSPSNEPRDGASCATMAIRAKSAALTFCGVCRPLHR